MNMWATEFAILRFMKENKNIMEWFSRVIEEGLDSNAFQQLIRIISDQRQVQEIIEFSKRGDVLQDFVDIMKEPYLKSKMKVYEISDTEDPLMEYTLAEINDIIAKNYKYEIGRFCDEAGYIVSVGECDSQNNKKGSKEVECNKIMFHDKEGYKVYLKTEVQEELRLLVSMNINTCKKLPIKTKNDDELYSLMLKINSINAIIPYGHYLLKKGTFDNDYTVDFQISYYTTRFEFDEKLFGQFLAEGLKVAKSNKIL